MAEKSFKDKTKGAIEWFAEWLSENAESLAGTFVDGGISWDIELHWHTADDCSYGVPYLRIQSEKVPPREIVADWWNTSE